MTVHRIVLAVFGIALVTANASAQTSDGSPLQIGDRIRIKTSSSSSAMKGTLVAADDAGLTLAPEGQDTTQQRFSRSEISRLEVARGKKSNVLWGALGGAVVGLGLDLVATADAEDPIFGDDAGLCDYGACVILPVAGAAAGALVGLLIKSERWETLPVEKVRVALLPTQHGVQLSLSLRF